MLSLFRWIYDLGRQHERLRIELEIRDYRYVEDLDEVRYYFNATEKEREKAEYEKRKFEEAVHGIIHPKKFRNEKRSSLDE